MSDTPIAVGQAVRYVPHACHWNDTDAQGQPLFELLGADGKPAQELQHGIGRDAAGRLHDWTGRPLTVGKPRGSWAAKVLRVNGDGSLDLEVQHPRGGQVHEYPNVKPSAAPEPHSWHLAEQES